MVQRRIAAAILGSMAVVLGGVLLYFSETKGDLWNVCLYMTIVMAVTSLILAIDWEE